MAEQMEKELDIRIEEVESIADEEAKIWNPTVEVGDILITHRCYHNNEWIMSHTQKKDHLDKDDSEWYNHIRELCLALILHNKNEPNTTGN